MTVEPTSGPPMHVGLCRGHGGSVWLAWLVGYGVCTRV